eukprot:TRINITY_DN20827_c0_g1_i5.p4 TRINITY_DN20827_c0_g1~~TRINITY_DN20827_c0_g1_i5.p4  ORF type:complete len:147 (-),score=43.90 TRINITY_DN20827_c0_g1_i5:10-450(-)
MSVLRGSISSPLISPSPLASSAHLANESYLTLEMHESSLSGEWMVKLSDLNTALQLDANGDGEIKGDEIEPRKTDIEDYLRSHLHVVVDGVELGLAFDRLLFGSQNGEDFILSRLKSPTPEHTQALEIGRAVQQECRDRSRMPSSA